ncbi:MAG: hypothetical protein R2771_07695 [Saprospiraceae bacterium]
MNSINENQNTDNKETIRKSNNPVITDVFTADPAAMVYNDTLFLYTGHDEAKLEDGFYKMNEWLVFSTVNMIDWQSYPVPLNIVTFRGQRQMLGLLR